MNSAELIAIKERLAIGEPLTPLQRDYVLQCLNTISPIVNAIEHNPGNYLGRIDILWAFLSLDDGGEGLCAGPLGGLPVVPFVTAQKRQLNILRPLAQHIARRFNKPVRLAKFTKREDVEILQP